MRELFEEHSYHGFVILANRLASTGDWYGWYFQVYKDKGTELVFGLQAKISRTEAHGTDGDQLVHERGLSRVRALIDLRRFERGDTYELQVQHLTQTETKNSDIRIEEIRRAILEAYYNLHAFMATSNVIGDLDVQGISDLLGIDRETYQIQAAILKEQGYLKEDSRPSVMISEGGGSITGKGITWLEDQVKLPTTPDKLFARSREYVDQKLLATMPKVAAKLQEVYVELANAHSDLKWKQIALACRDIIQDFTDTLVEVLPSEIERPPREKTKNKLRLILKHKGEGVGDSAREFAEAQADYVLTYFDKLNKNLIQRNVHAPTMDRLNAERSVIYTYLFIGDVLSLLAE